MSTLALAHTHTAKYTYFEGDVFHERVNELVFYSVFPFIESVMLWSSIALQNAGRKGFDRMKHLRNGGKTDSRSRNDVANWQVGMGSSRLTALGAGALYEYFK